MDLLGQTNALQDLCGGVGLVEGVEVKTWNSGFKEFLTLLCGVFDTEFGSGFVVVLEFFEALVQG